MHRYETRVRPPTPSLEIQVIHPVTGTTHQWPAKLDTGAALTILPEAVVDALALSPKGEATIYGYDGMAAIRPLYYVNLEVVGHSLSAVRVTSSKRSDILLGRDLLNHFTITLNGKDLTFDIKDP
ncbi:MAG: retroviral-like aspartic protease family protein [Anaerolineae bacterium]